MNQPESMWQVNIPREQSSLTLRGLLCLAMSLVEAAQRAGGSGRCFCGPKAVVVETAGLTGEEIDKSVDAFASTALSGTNRGAFIRKEIPALTAAPDAPIRPGQYTRTKLTKAFLDELPPGAILVSNVFDSDGCPVFREPVGEPHDRDEVWDAAKAAGANNRLVEIVWNTDDADELCRLPGFDIPPSRTQF